MRRQKPATNFHTNNSNNIKVTTTLKTASNVPTNSSNLKSSGNCTNKQMQQTHSNDDSSSNQQQQQTTSDNSVDKSSSSNELTIDGSLHSHGSSEWSYNNRCLPENGNFNFKWSESFFCLVKAKVWRTNFWKSKKPLDWKLSSVNSAGLLYYVFARAVLDKYRDNLLFKVKVLLKRG